jgi:hypothetical protein
MKHLCCSCTSCFLLEREFRKAAQILKAEEAPILLGTVDCADNATQLVCSISGLKEFPAYLMFKNGKFLHEYDGMAEKASKFQVSSGSTF